MIIEELKEVTVYTVRIECNKENHSEKCIREGDDLTYFACETIFKCTRVP